MKHYINKTKKGWRKSDIFQSDPVTKAVNSANEILQEKINKNIEIDYIDVYTDFDKRNNLCKVNDNLMLKETREKLLIAGWIIEEKDLEV